jgi:hypothetical protein
MADEEVITCCGRRETHKQGVLSDTVHCHREESNPSRPQIQSLSPNVLPQMPQNFSVKLCVDSLALGDELAMNNTADVEKHKEHGLR